MSAADIDIPCKSCGSNNRSKFNGEIAIHLPGLKNIDQPIVWVFAELVACLDCGIVEFAVPEAQIPQLKMGDTAAAG
jgi:hypothetical protein